ncbi:MULTISPECIES: NAD(P)H-binding protein [Thiomicrorhabdus]|uniref:NAD(P)H-binding protein n=1 Tax=Thiomicrorhabdus heinhorstiae TaxID=2748010 RepID=A0ABS0BWJ0_9GAMM|nr:MULTISPECIES: NAD(P)H-binding protein [Thiomicrorhabdus]MBF6058181.1 NAD(P)H-binding protein [Thiomicrorhabdus heinhorstiae]
MLGNKVSVFGGTGFVGRAVVAALSNAGYQIDLVVRRPERFREFALYPNTKVRTLSSFDDSEALKAILNGSDIVINLLADRSKTTEMIEADDLVEVNRKLKSAMESAGVKRVVSLSQLGASTKQDSHAWLGTLGEADSLMHGTASAAVTILRSSLIIGEGDESTAYFVKQLKRMSLLMVANASTSVQPIWVKDLAGALVSVIRNEETFGKKLEVAGEERMSMKDLGDLVAEIMDEDAVVLPMCSLNARIMSTLGGLAPIISVSKAQVLTLGADQVSDADFSKLFGFTPSNLDWAISTYAAPQHVRERYNSYRKTANRDL